ncbi:bile acid:sodium symporter [Nocardioides limicola]|uniref:bile acid:sodium symporter n=1 Tax=Nocardioides limicola TaxID=2803368 RepID=UPI00193B3025|nr:bile acid:sodium symporter [Nocardioides sp. DJM-14]
MAPLTLERQQVWLYLVALGAGLLVCTVAPVVGPVAETLVWPVLGLLLFTTFVQVPLLHLREAVTDTRFTGVALVGNFVLVPLLVWGLVQFLPDDPAIRLGVLLVLLVPCTDWFITFTHLAGGDSARAVTLTPVNLVLQLLLLPGYLWLIARSDVAGVLTPAQVAPAVLVVAVPLLVAVATEWGIDRGPVPASARDRLRWGPVPLLALVIFLIAAAQVDAVVDAIEVLPSIVPVFVAFLVAVAALASVLARAVSLPPAQGRTLAFTLATRNSFVVLPLALALPAGFEVAVVAIVVQSLVELWGMIAYLWWVPRAFPTR